MKKGRGLLLSVMTLIILGAAIAAFFTLNHTKKKLVIFHAGSLNYPLQKLAERYEYYHPEVTIEDEAAGSVASIRKITEQGRIADLLFSADYKLIDNMMVNSDTKWANWSIVFARNAIVIAYTNNSRYHNIINADNWFMILNKTKDIVVGRSNPAADPCGYRALLTIKLASIYYNDSTIWDNLLSQPSLKTPYASAESQLVAPLQLGELDYAFLYESMALQYNLSYVKLPEEINLANISYSNFYQQATVYYDSVTGDIKDGPGEGITTRIGKAIYYGLTITLVSPNYDLALDFVKFVLSEEGLDIISNQCFQPVISPPETANLSLLPPELRPLCVENPNL